LVPSGGKERRRAPRSEQGFPVIEDDETSAFVDYVENISIGGALCRTVEPVPMMAKVALAFELPGMGLGRMDCDGVVVRQVSDDGSAYVGVVFTNLPDHIREAIDQFVSTTRN